MIAPSPDWIVAVRGLNLLENGEFIDRRIVQFSPYDTGSDSGVSYASPNQPTVPQQPITPITGGVLANNGSIASFGIWRFERIDEFNNCGVRAGSLAGGPVSFCMDGSADILDANSISLTGDNALNQSLITDELGFIVALPGTLSCLLYTSPSPRDRG